MLDAGFGVIPYALLDAIPKLGITPEEFLFIIHALRFKWDKNNPFPSVSRLAANMGKSTRTIQNYRSSLVEKGFLECKFRPNDTSVLDFSPLLAAVRKLLKEVKYLSPPETSDTQGVKDTSPPPMKDPSSRRKRTKNKETEEEEPVFEPSLERTRYNEPIFQPEEGEQQANQSSVNDDDPDEKFLQSLEDPDELKGILAIQSHWRANTEEGELPAKTAAYWLFAYPKGWWNYLETEGLQRALQLVIRAMDRAFEKNRQGKVRDLIAFLNAGIQDEKNPYLIDD